MSEQLGRVVASHGRHVLVQTPEGRELICHPRGKKNQAVVGDIVRWAATGDEGTIEAIEPRRNLFYRQDEIRTKSFAANLDQILILLGAEPEFSEHQLTRALIAAEAEGITPLIVLNKSDLTQAHARAWQRLAPYRRMGYRVLPLCLRHGSSDDSGDDSGDNSGSDSGGQASGVSTLHAALQGHATLVLGPSGTGKSTLINHLVPGARAETGEISTALNSGRHTTTHTRWYWLDAQRQTALLDSPGFQEFGLHHIEPARLASLMPDLRAHLGGCRFYNCTHRHEPGCAVLAAVADAPDSADTPQDAIAPNRYRIYSDLYDELSQPRF